MATPFIRKLNPVYICRWLVSKAIWNSRVLLTYLGLFSNCDRARLEKLKNIHHGRTAFLIGNGPSVKPGDLEKLQNEVTFCFNRFHLAYDMFTFRPKYTVSADIGMIGDFGVRIVQESAGTVFLADKKRPGIPGEFTWIGAKYQGPPLVFSKKIYHHVAIGGSSLVTALQLGYFMGIRHFILYGVDHDFHYSEKPEKTDNDYRSAVGDDNHFIKNYRSGKPWCPPHMEMIEKSLVWADRFLRKKGGWIINAIRGGKLEILERKPFEEVIDNLPPAARFL
ncbi:MAG: hypothetical protein GY950_30310 [bacterium]|nr:hypothetical protein [bacterium]